MNLGYNLKKFREAKGIKKIELEQYLNKSKGVVTKWENGENKPNADIICEICNFLDITPNMLFDWKPSTSDMYDLLVNERQLINMYRKLNKEGQNKLLDSADDLVASKKYEVSNDYITVVAARGDSHKQVKISKKAIEEDLKNYIEPDSL